jgi:hypothetical protein
MKPLKVLVLIALTACAFACRKSYTCKCQVVSVPEGSYSEFTIKENNRQEALEECNEHSTLTTNQIPQGYDTYCTLKE